MIVEVNHEKAEVILVSLDDNQLYWDAVYG